MYKHLSLSLFISLLVFLDMVFMMGEMHNETRKERDRHQGMNDMLPRSAPAYEFNCETSSGHFVMRYRFHKILKKHVRMVAQLRRERMVTHDLANTSFWIPV